MLPVLSLILPDDNQPILYVTPTAPRPKPSINRITYTNELTLQEINVINVINVINELESIQINKQV